MTFVAAAARGEVKQETAMEPVSISSRPEPAAVGKELSKVFSLRALAALAGLVSRSPKKGKNQIKREKAGRPDPTPTPVTRRQLEVVESLAVMRQLQNRAANHRRSASKRLTTNLKKLRRASRAAAR